MRKEEILAKNVCIVNLHWKSFIALHSLISIIQHDVCINAFASVLPESTLRFSPYTHTHTHPPQVEWRNGRGFSLIEWERWNEKIWSRTIEREWEKERVVNSSAEKWGCESKVVRYHFMQYCMENGIIKYTIESKMRQNVGKINGSVELWNAANGTNEADWL